MRVEVLGGRESGVGAALLAHSLGHEVWVSDSGLIPDAYRSQLSEEGIDIEENGHSLDRIAKADIVVKSPGIPDHIPLLEELRRLGIEVVSEIEWGYRHAKGRHIAITGTNGKTTTSMWIHHLLVQDGQEYCLGGNIGDSYARQVRDRKYANYVLEVSSFQLDGIRDFRPDIAVLTSITPDHLDRYGGVFERYVASKFRLTENQGPEDYFIYNADDPVIGQGIKKYNRLHRALGFSTKKPLQPGAYLKEEKIIMETSDRTVEIEWEQLPLLGIHNVQNAMAAGLVGMLSGIGDETLRESIRSFQGAAHRMEKVLRRGGVTYINDSKATNVNAAYYALQSVNAPVIWIAGGVDKGNDYWDLMPAVREKVKALICIGVDNQPLLEVFGSVIDPIVEVDGMAEAVQVAQRYAQSGDTVLLSPACASFDRFENYEDRGDQFKYNVTLR